MLRMRSYDVLTPLNLFEPNYVHNGGMWGTDLTVNQCMALELLEKRVCVMHPEATRQQRLDAVRMCRFLRLPLLRMEDLPAMPTDNEEVLDSLNVVGDPAWDVDEVVGEPSHLDALLAEDVREYDGQRIWDNLRVVCLRKAMAAWRWCNAQLSGLKNPVVRERQLGERPYVLRTDPLSTTG